MWWWFERTEKKVDELTEAVRKLTDAVEKASFSLQATPCDKCVKFQISKKEHTHGQTLDCCGKAGCSCASGDDGEVALEHAGASTLS
jgi:hypothetical protein